MKTRFTELMGIEHPLVQAGMAGGPTTPELVAAVSEAGGLGTIGAAYMTPDAIREAVRRIRELTKKPFAVNLFIVGMKDDYSRLGEVEPVMAPMRAKLGADAGPPAATPDRVRRQFEVLLEEGVPAVSTVFGLLPEEWRKEAESRGMLYIATATSVDEALQAEASGAHAIVAQGGDAGGHRGTFDTERHPQGHLVGTFSLIPQAADAVRVPVVAAGGIMDGRGVAAALMLGAEAAQLGTRFLTARESGAHPAYQRALLQSRETDTVVTTAFSGRPARGIRNAFIAAFEEAGVQPLPFPSQNTLTSPLRQAAARASDANYMSLWAGQGLRLLQEPQAAADIVRSIVEDAANRLGRK